MLCLKPKRGKRRRGCGSRNANTRGNSCEFCVREYDLAKRENCTAFGRSCNKCGKKNHFANVCFGHVPKSTTRTHPMYCFEDELSDEVFGVEEISAVTLDDSQLVTLKLESGNYLRFQPDTRAPCNVVPLHLYKKATKDVDFCNVTPPNTAIISYGGTLIPILGKVPLRVWRGDFKCLFDCNLVDSKKVRPILGRKACLGMNVIYYLDNDQLNRLQESDGEVYTHDVPASSPPSPSEIQNNAHRVRSMHSRSSLFSVVFMCLISATQKFKLEKNTLNTKE